MTTSKGEANAYRLTTPDSWWNTTLEEVCSGDGGRIQTGPFGSQLHAHDYRDEGTPVVMPKQLGDNMISTDGIARISDADVERLSRHKLREGDIVFSRRGDVTRRSYITRHEEGWLCGTGCMLIRPSHEDLLNEFLALFFSLPQFKDYITLNAVGATMPNLNTTILQNIPLFLPSRVTQRKIVAVISAYDDLIENNTRRIAILEEMAQAIYREWFVHFRFPGHENVKLVDSPLGQIPEGWEVGSVGDFGTIITGKTPSKKWPEFFGGDVPFVRIPDMHGNLFCLSTTDTLTEEGMASQSRQTVPADSVCISCIGTVGVISITASECQTNQQINTVILSAEHWREYIVVCLIENSPRLKQMGAGGATMDNISKGKLTSFPVVLPPESIVQLFSNYGRDLFDRIRLLQRQVSMLRTTRDLLLPKLISGKLDVEDLDIDVGEPLEELEEATA